MKLYKTLLAGVLMLTLAISSPIFATSPLALHDSRAGLPRNLAGQHTLMATVRYLRTMVYKAANAHEKHREIIDLLGLEQAVPKLDFSEEQMKKLIQLNLDHEKVVIRKNAAALEAAAELETLLAYQDANPKKISNKIYEIMGAVTDIYQDCVTTNIAVRALLTEEQSDIVDENCQCSVQNEKQNHPFMGYFKGMKKRGNNKMMPGKKGMMMEENN